jgi:hypothetical protein
MAPLGGDICRLCLKSSELRNSHILPEFFYASLYDDLHRVMNVPSDGKEKFMQKGEREYLLCQECESKLSKYEGYTAKLISKIQNFPKDNSGLFVYSDCVDYKQFKLFQLSILWRASVSQRKMFAQVDLGSKHEERIRRMLVDEIPGKSSDYGCFIIMFPNPKNLDKIIWSPARVKLFGHNGYKLMTGNLMWYFFVTSHAPNAEFQEFFVQESGMLRVWLDVNGEKVVYENMIRALKSRKM